MLAFHKLLKLKRSTRARLGSNLYLAQSVVQSGPKWAAEKEIQSIKTLQKISYQEARKIVQCRLPREGLSYASALRQYKSCSTQTELPFANSSPSPSKNKQSKKYSAKPITTESSNKPLSVQTVFTQRPLNKAIPGKDLIKRMKKSAPKTKKKNSHSSPAKQRKYDKQLQHRIETTDDEDTIEMFTSDLEDVEQYDHSKVAQEQPRLPSGAHCANFFDSINNT